MTFQTSLQAQIDQEVGMQASRARSECDQKMFELGRKNAILIEKYQEDFDVMKEEMEGKINRLREVYTIKNTFYLLSLFLAAVKGRPPREIIHTP